METLKEEIRSINLEQSEFENRYFILKTLLTLFNKLSSSNAETELIGSLSQHSSKCGKHSFATLLEEIKPLIMKKSESESESRDYINNKIYSTLVFSDLHDSCARIELILFKSNRSFKT